MQTYSPLLGSPGPAQGLESPPILNGDEVSPAKRNVTPLPRWQMLAYSGIRSSEVRWICRDVFFRCSDLMFARV